MLEDMGEGDQREATEVGQREEPARVRVEAQRADVGRAAGRWIDAGEAREPAALQRLEKASVGAPDIEHRPVVPGNPLREKLREVFQALAVMDAVSATGADGAVFVL